MPEFYVYDPEKAWQSSLDASREDDPMLHDARLLTDTHKYVKSKSTQNIKTYQTKKVMKYSTEWWREWKKKTKMTHSRNGTAISQSHNLNRLGNNTKAFSETKFQDKSIAPKELNKVDLGQGGHDMGSKSHVESFETPLSVDGMHSLNVEDLMKQSRRRKQRTYTNENLNDNDGDGVEFPSIEKNTMSVSSTNRITTISEKKSTLKNSSNSSTSDEKNTLVNQSLMDKGNTQPFYDTCSVDEVNHTTSSSHQHSSSSSSPSPPSPPSSSLQNHNIELEPFKSSKPGAKFSTEERSFNVKKSNESPGPIYKPNSSVVKTNYGGTGAKFGTEKRASMNQKGSGSGGGGGGGTDAIYILPSTLGNKHSKKTDFTNSGLRSWDKEDKKNALLLCAQEDAEREYEEELNEENNDSMPYGDDDDYADGNDDETVGSYYSSTSSQIKPKNKNNHNSRANHKKISSTTSDTPSNTSLNHILKDDKDIFPCKLFGYGCSVEEHIEYGQCLDGLCCQRSHLEKVMKSKIKKKLLNETSRLDHHERHRRAAIIQQEPSKKTALHFACEKNKLSIIHKMLLNGSQIDSIDENGRTPLSLASESGHIRIVIRLLMNPQYPYISPKGFVNQRLAPSINVTDNYGRTSLHYASLKGNHQIVLKLLEAGANAEIQDHDSKTALDVCTSSLAFQHLRSRAEVFIRRERYEGIVLKANLVDSTSELLDRIDIKTQCNKLKDEVEDYKSASIIMNDRVNRIDNDILNFKAKGKVKLKTSDLLKDSELSNDMLTNFCHEQSIEKNKHKSNHDLNHRAKHHHHHHYHHKDKK